MFPQTKPSKWAGSRTSGETTSLTPYARTPEAAPLVNQLGDDRPAWLAALNLTAARHFLESDPPRLAGGHVSLLRLVMSLEQDPAVSEIAGSSGLQSQLEMPSDLELRAVARQAAAIAAELAQMIDRDAHDEATLPDTHTDLNAVRYSIRDLDRAIAALLGDRCQTASLSIPH